MTWTFEQTLASIAAIAGGLTFGAAIAMMVMRVLFKDWVEWRKRVEVKLDRLQPEHVLKIEGFDPERLTEHYARTHKLANDLTVTSLDVGRLSRGHDDHEGRLRTIELRRRKIDSDRGRVGSHPGK